MNPFSHLSDEELMRLYQKGESMAFEVIYARNKGRIYSYLNKRVDDTQSVNEIFQNAMLKFHNCRMNYDPTFPLAKWLYTISRSEMLDFFRRKTISFDVLKEEHFGAGIPIPPPVFNLDEVESLNENEKKAVSLRYYSDMDFKEISTLLNLSEQNIRKIISRGLKKIRSKYLGGQHE